MEVSMVPNIYLFFNRYFYERLSWGREFQAFNVNQLVTQFQLQTAVASLQ